jgi:hypothetical protein
VSAYRVFCRECLPGRETKVAEADDLEVAGELLSAHLRTVHARPAPGDRVVSLNPATSRQKGRGR